MMASTKSILSHGSEMEDGNRKESRALERVRTIARKRIEYERRSAQHPQQHWRSVVRTVRTSARRERSTRATKVCKHVHNALVEQERELRDEPKVAPAPLVAATTGEHSADADTVGTHLQVAVDDLDAGSAATNNGKQAALDLKLGCLLHDAEVSPDRVPEIAQAIVQTMAVDLEDVALQTASAQALDHLSTGGTRNSAAIATAGGIQILVSIAGMHKDAEILQEVLCKVLRAIIVVGLEFRAAVASAGAVRVVVCAMTENRASAAVQLAGCRALKELAAHSATIQDEICLNCGVEAVINAMEMHSSAASVQEAACGVLRNLSAGNAKHQNQIAALGGLRLVLLAMSLHSQDALVQWAGCWALFCLTLQNAELQSKVAASGGLQNVVQAMDGHRSVPKVQEAGCWAIKVLSATGEPILALSARGAAFLAMRAHPLDEQVQRAGRAALQSTGGFTTPRTTTRMADAAAQAKSSKRHHSAVICSLPTIPE